MLLGDDFRSGCCCSSASSYAFGTCCEVKKYLAFSKARKR